MAFTELKESDLDNCFIGQLELFEVDDYHTVKAGTAAHSGVVRSQLSKDRKTLKLVGYLPKRFNVRAFPADGQVGLYGKITERFKAGEDMVRIESLYLRFVSPRDIAHGQPLLDQPWGERYETFEGEVEFDDVLFNLNEEFTFPVTYYKRRGHLVGIEVDIPVVQFNRYVSLRNVWYRDYKGSPEIRPMLEEPKVKHRRIEVLK